MVIRIIIILSFILFFSSCSKDEIIYKPSEQIDPFKVYSEGLEAFNQNDFFYANKKFSEAELNFENIELAAKSAIMSSFSLYGINFYQEAEESLIRFLEKYPSDKNVIYAHYLLAIIYFEQISDEKKDLAPLIKADKKIDDFVERFPDTDYTTDLKFKKNLIQNQLAAKELFVAKYYISVQKWVPAINRLKVIVNKYSTTIFIEEALHRLVEIHYHLGIGSEAQMYTQILGYNYNSSEWYQESYKILNKDYKIKKDKKIKKKDGLLKKIIKRIK